MSAGPFPCSTPPKPGGQRRCSRPNRGDGRFAAPQFQQVRQAKILAWTSNGFLGDDATGREALMSIDKRKFLAALAAVGASTGLAAAQPAKKQVSYGPQRREIPHGMVKTTKLFKAPPGYVNALALAPEGIWLGQQKLSGKAAESYHLPEPDDLREAAWLVDWNGKLLKTVYTNSRNTSGMAYGNGCVWMMANQEPEGVFQVDMNSKEISHRQIPLALPGQDGGGSHGAQWHNGKLWIVANRPR